MVAFEDRFALCGICVMRRSAIVVAVCWLAAAGGDAASGDVRTFAFTGRVTSLRDGLGVFGQQAAELTAFSGTYTFDTSTPPLVPLPSDAREAVYRHASPPAGVSVQLGEFAFHSAANATDFRIRVGNDMGAPAADAYGFVSFRNEAQGLLGGWNLDLMEIDWGSTTSQVDLFAGLAMPVAPPNLAVLGPGEFHILGECFACDVADPTFELWGEFVTLTSASTPRVGDLDGSGVVDRADVAMLVSSLGWTDGEGSAGSPAADLNGDGKVGLADLMLLHGNLSPAAAIASRQDDASAHFALAAENVSEPTGLMLLAMATLALAARRASSKRRRR
jgi:hypothetical protein